MWGISYGTLGACHMWKKKLLEGRNFRWHHRGETHVGGRHFWRGVQTLEDTMEIKLNIVQSLCYNLNFKETTALTPLVSETCLLLHRPYNGS